MSLSITVKLVIFFAAIGGFVIMMSWSLWLMNQSNNIAFLAGPCFIVLAISALLRICKLVFTTTKEIH